MPDESPVFKFPMLLRPSGATLYWLRLEFPQPHIATAESSTVQEGSPAGWQTGGSISALASFGADHPGFQGHFPGSPILPGFLHVQLAIDIVRLFEPQAELAAILSAKFHHPILPGAEIQVALFCLSPNQGTSILQIGEVAASRMDFEFYTGPEPAYAAVGLQTS